MAKFDLTVLLLAKDMASKTIGKVGKEVGTLGRISGHAVRGVQNLGTNLVKLGAVASVGIGVAVRSGIESLATLESAVASVDGAIAQMGLTVSGSQVATWANEIEAATGAAFDDKDIVAATENIIRYGKVTEDNLRPAMEVMTDLAAKTGSVESAAELLGKALADPAKAAGKLSRYGIILTKAQQKQLAAMMEVNDVAGAQALLLEELAKTTTGAAAASQGPYKRAMSVLADVTEDAQRALAEGFLPVLMRASELLGKALADPKVINNIRAFGKTLASGLDSLISIAQNLPWAQIGQSLQIAGAGAKAVLGAFTALPPWVQTAVLTGWGLNKLTGGALGSIVGELGKGLVKGVLNTNTAVMNVKAGVVNGLGGLPGGKGGGGLPAKIGAGSILAGGAALAIGTAIGAGIVVGASALIDVLDPNARTKEGLAGATGNNSNRNPRDSSGRTRQQVQDADAGKKLSDVFTEIRNGFLVQATAIKNGFTTVTSGGSKTTAEIRNGFNVNAQKTAGLASTIRSGDERTGTRLGSLNAAVNRTTSTLAAKNFSPRITVPVTVTTNVSVRAVTQRQRTVQRYTRGSGTGTVAL